VHVRNPGAEFFANDSVSFWFFNAHTGDHSESVMKCVRRRVARVPGVSGAL
jgi:hypothetical protein